MKLINEDEALIAAALNGSAYAWEKLVKRYEGQIYNQGLRLTGNPTDAMDLMQEVFLGVYRNLHRFRGDALFSSWIFRIAHNKAIDLNRRKRLLSNQTNFPDQDETGGFEALPGADKFEPEAGLNKELKIFQSQTFEEIAGLQDISVNTVKTRFYAALKKLKVVSEETYVLP